MKQHRPNKHHMDGLLTLLLFGVFAACVLSVLLTGANAYRRLTARDQKGYDRRTCAQYVATKVRQAASPEAISLSTFGDGDVLLLSEEYDGERYLTRIYCYDGWLRELFTAAGEEFSPEDGEQVLEAENLSLHLEDSLLKVTVTDGQGADTALTLAIRGGKEAVG